VEYYISSIISVGNIINVLTKKFNWKIIATYYIFPTEHPMNVEQQLGQKRM